MGKNLPGTCCDCGAVTSSKYKKRCNRCSRREVWSRRGVPRIPEGALIDDCFRDEAEKHQWAFDPDGYCKAIIERKKVRLHQFVWALSGRPLPERPLTLDHANRNRADNRLENLRLATKSLQSQNSKNRDRHLPRGVYRNGGRYAAMARYHGKAVHLGTYATPEEASVAYEKKRAELIALELSLLGDSHQ